MMLRFLQIAVLFLCVLAAGPALAQSVEVRTGEHDNYSRLVFDWGKSVSYSLTEAGPGKLIVKFSQPGSVSNPGVKAHNVTGISVVSQAPLELAITIPQNSNARDFQAGNRIIVDIYDPPGAKRPAQLAETKPQPKPEPPPPPPKQEEKPKVTAPKTAEAKPAPPKTPASEPVKKMLEPAPPAARAEVETVVGADLAPPDEELLKDSEGRKAPVRPSNLITLSTIDAMGMAVFERDGAIWLVSDKNDIMLTPQVSGPEAKHFLPVETIEIEGGKIFRLRAMEDAIIRGQGGGLLWRVVVPAGPSKTKPTIPKRVDVNPAEARGASIVWPLGEARRLFNIVDPVTGRTMIVVTVASAKKYAGEALRFIDFETLETPVGLVIIPKVDDLQVTITPAGDVEVTRPGGLALTSDAKMAALEASAAKRVQPGSQANAKRVFDLRNWEMGGLESLDGNHNIIMSNIGGLQSSERVEGILTLAKMYLSNGMWAESKGFLDLAQDEMPELNQNPAFMALYGAAQALGLESEEAFNRLSADELKQYPEIGYWRAYALADLGDWQQADSVFPAELYILSQYSPLVKIRLSLVLAEVALRAGETAKGEQLLSFVEDYKDLLKPQQIAAMNYLKGEAARQRKKTDDTKKYWQKLAKGRDDMYRAKAGLALTRLLTEKKELTDEKAIDNLERLRYAWRGDELEAQIAYWLGRTYFEHKDFVKGLVIMREAATYASETDVGRKIVSEMTDVFKKLFLGPDLDTVSALDAAALHAQFKEYLPEGAEGDKIAQRLAERLVKADLLDKAAELLKSQVDRLPAGDAFNVATRLAAIYLIDNKPAQALATLSKAGEIYTKMPQEMKSADKELELSLLRARALSKQDRFEQALALLNSLERGPDVNNLRADIAWHAGYWDEAAQALDDVILDRNISLTRPLEEQNTALILQRAVALNLSGDRVALAQMREKFSDVMNQTDKARIFEVITRPRQSAALADRKTLMGIVSEVDLFRDFLESYRGKETAAAETAAAETAAAETPPPAEAPTSQ